MRQSALLKGTAAILLGGALLIGGVDGAGDPVFAQGKSGSAGGGGSKGASSNSGGGSKSSASSRGGGNGNGYGRGNGAERRGPPDTGNNRGGNAGGDVLLLEDDGTSGGGRPEHAGRPDHAGGNKAAKEPAGAKLSKDAKEGLGQGSLSSRMGALNAAHASEQALANASPNSRVGRIAAYRDAVLAGEEISGDLEDTQALLEALDDPEGSVLKILAGEEIGNEELEQKVLEVAALREDVANGEATQEELNTAIGELETLYNEVYADAVEREEELSDQLGESAEEAQRLLDEAANKPVDSDVVVEVNRLLGLSDDPLDGLLLELYEEDAGGDATTTTE